MNLLLQLLLKVPRNRFKLIRFDYIEDMSAIITSVALFPLSFFLLLTLFTEPTNFSSLSLSLSFGPMSRINIPLHLFLSSSSISVFFEPCVISECVVLKNQTANVGRVKCCSPFSFFLLPKYPHPSSQRNEWISANNDFEFLDSIVFN